MTVSEIESKTKAMVTVLGQIDSSVSMSDLYDKDFTKDDLKQIEASIREVLDAAKVALITVRQKKRKAKG